MEDVDGFIGMNIIMEGFIERIRIGYANVEPYVRRLVFFLLGIDLALVGIRAMFGEGANIGTAVRKILFIGCWTFIIFNLDQLATYLLHSLVQLGLIASGIEGGQEEINAAVIISNPMVIIQESVQKLSAMYTAIPKGLFNIGNVLLGLFVLLTGTLCFGFIFMQILISTAEFYLLILCSTLLVGFCLLEYTKFIGEKTISSIVNSAIKLMVLVIIAGISLPLIMQSMDVLLEQKESSIMSLLYILLLILLAGYLCSKAPVLASALTGGHVGIAPNGIMGVMAGAASGMMSALSVLQVHKKKEDSALQVKQLRQLGRGIAGGTAETAGAVRQAVAMGKNPISAGLRTAGSSLVRSATGVSKKYLKSRYMQGRMREKISK